MEILGDDEEDRSAADRPPVDPRATAWAPGTAALRSAALPDRNAGGRHAQAGPGDGAYRRGGADRGTGGAFASPLGGRAPVLDLGEQARDPAWEQTWNTGPLPPLTTVRVDDARRPPGPTLAGPTTPPAGQPAAPESPGAPDAPGAAHVPGAPLATGTAPVAAAPASVRNVLVGTIAAAESLGVSGVLIAFGTSLTSLPSLFAFMPASATPRSQYEVFAMTFALGGVLAVVLGVAACLRLKPDSHPLVRGLAGAAVILGLTLVTLAAFTTIHASDVQPGYDGT